MKPAFAVLTVSDKCAAGHREDISGPEAVRIMAEAGWELKIAEIVPDDAQKISEKLKQYSDDLGVTLVLTTGGTGFSPRDVTPESTLAITERNVPGMAEAMRAKSLEITPHAMLSRAVTGIRGKTLIVNLPGSQKAVKECLDVILPSLPHAVELLSGLPVNCGR